jgi:hypothetical protein
MTCIHIKDGIVCVGNPTEVVTMSTGRKLRLEWHNYFGPSVETRNGLRFLTSAEFRDPNVDAWLVSKGCKSCREDKGPRLPKQRRRKPKPFDPTKPAQPNVRHKAKYMDGHGNTSALCFAKPRAVDLSRETAVLVDGNVTCPKCLALMGKS